MKGVRLVCSISIPVPFAAASRNSAVAATLRKHHRSATFAGNAKLSTRLHRIVVNAALMKLRSRRRKPETSLDDLLPCFDEEGEWANPATDWQISTDTLLQRQETREQVQQCIDHFPSTYRTILMLRDIYVGEPFLVLYVLLYPDRLGWTGIAEIDLLSIHFALGLPRGEHHLGTHGDQHAARTHEPERDG